MGVFFTLYRFYEGKLATVFGAKYVGAISRRDNKVRPEHQSNDGTFWKRGLKFPHKDYNCRCTYIFFKKPEDAIKAGFKLTSR